MPALCKVINAVELLHKICPKKKFKQQNSVCAVLQKYVSAHILMSHDKCNWCVCPAWRLDIV